MSNDFKQVNYSQFRNTLSSSAGQKVKSKGLQTWIYDRNNQILAVLKAASISVLGKAEPAQYYIRAGV